ncbi:MAG: MCE family protein [Actinomycetota bacterium]
MLTRLVRWQLTIFALVTVFAVTVVAVGYLRLPAFFGYGTYHVTVNLTASGGLYQNANVTYRGTTIGHVAAVSLARGNSVDARLQLDSDTSVPANVSAAVRSMSAIGEQYVDLIPPPQPSAEPLRDGTRIDQDRTSLPGDVATLLHEAESLVDSLQQSRLRDLLRETFRAFDGSGPELARLLESSRLLVDEANAHTDETTALIRQSEPFLDAQIRAGSDIGAVSDGLARLTTQLRDADQGVRSVLETAPGAADIATATVDGIRPTFPVLAANLANFGRIGVIYNKSIEQVLVIFPALTAALLTVAQGVPADEGAKADFKFNVADPPPCLTGFIPPTQQRSPADETLRDLPRDMYCKVPQNDPTSVRGARNYPCQEFPGKRAPTIQLCRDPAGYVPIGSNPWRGPPIPVGTPMSPENAGQNVLPMNKYPYIPPQADYDPGPPVVHLPPGVPPGPGPALTAPYPKEGPPVTTGPPPPPLPFQAPPEQQVPPYGRPPAEAPAPMSNATTTYDADTGQYQDPNGGGIGVFASGATRRIQSENWVDLMMYPKVLQP